jgi:WD40 repeat protein
LIVITLSPVFSQAEEKAVDERKGAAISIAEIKHTTPVDFEKEVLPILKNNCLACHNQTKAKADLVLETPQTILKGGESGPAVIPGNSIESLLLKVASHQEKPRMPPRDNKVAAVDLTPEELGLIKLWIDQGAKGEVRAVAPIEWRPLPPGLNPIYALAVTSDGQFAACGRANQIFVYHLPSRQLITRLTDPHLLKTNADGRPGVAHRDLVHALAFSPDGTLLASGGFREVKIWRRPRNVEKFRLASPSSNAVRTVAGSRDGKWLATGETNGVIQLWDLTSGKAVRTLSGHEAAITSLKFSPDNAKLCSGSVDKSIRVWTLAEGSLFAQTNTVAEVNAVTWVHRDTQLAVAGSDHIIRILQLPEAASGALTLVKELKGHEGAVTTLDTMAPGGMQIISGSADGSIRHWDVDKGEVIRQMKQDGLVTAVAARSDGKRFASAGLNNMAKLWNAEDGKQIADLKGDRYAQEFAANVERDLTLAVGEVAYRKTSLEAAEKQHKTQLERVTKANEAFASAEKTFKEKQQAMTAAGEAQAAAEKGLADVNAEIKKVTDDFNEAEKVAKLAATEAKTAMEKATQAKIAADQAAQTKLEMEKVAADAAAVAAKTKAAAENSGAPAESKPADSKTASEKMAAEAEAVAVKAKAFSESVAADAAAKLKLAADIKMAAEKAIDEVAAKSYTAGQIKVAYERLTNAAPEKVKQATDKLTTATNAFVSAEKEFKKAEITKSTTDNELQLANKAAKKAEDAVNAAKGILQTAEAEQKKKDGELQSARKAAAELEKPIRSLSFSPDGLALATGGDDELVHTWSAEDGTAFETFKGHSSAIQGVVFAGPASLVSVSGDPGAVVWDSNAGWTLERVIGTGGEDSPLVDRVNALRFSPDGRDLAAGGGEPTRSSEIKIWALAGTNVVREFKNIHSDAVFTLDYSPDGKYLASGAADRFVRVLDLTNGKVLKSFEGHTHHVLGVSWKRDGRTLASAGADNVIKIWDFGTGERKKNIDGASKEVTSISFIGITDQTIASSADAQLRIIRDNGENVRSLSGATDYLYASAATPDGKTIVAGGQDSVLHVWDGRDGKVLMKLAPPD